MESSGAPGFGPGTRGAVVFPHPWPTPTQAAWPWLGAGERAGMFVPLFLGRERCWDTQQTGSTDEAIKRWFIYCKISLMEGWDLHSVPAHQKPF